MGIDLIRPLPEADGKWRILLQPVCYFTKFVEAKAIPDKTGLEIAWFIYDLMMRYGVFSVAISDQGLFLIFPFPFKLMYINIYTLYKPCILLLSGTEFNNAVVDEIVQIVWGLNIK